MRKIHFQVADRMEYAEWLNVRNPNKRGKTIVIELYEMDIKDCIPIVFSVDKNEIRPAEYDRVSAWVSKALGVPNQSLSFVQNEPFVKKQLGLISVSNQRIERIDGTICISSSIAPYIDVVPKGLSIQFITIFSSKLALNEDDQSCISSIKSDIDMTPTRDQIEYMMNRFGAFASSIPSHYPADFPAYVLWCKSDLVDKITSHDDDAITLFEEERPILQCTTGNHDWGKSD